MLYVSAVMSQLPAGNCMRVGMMLNREESVSSCV